MDEEQPVVKSKQQKEMEEAYNFLADSGNKYLKANLIDKAQTEFTYALNIHKNGRKARIGLAKVLIKRCNLYGSLCSEAEENINFLIEMEYASEKEIEEWKIVKE